MEDVIQTNPAPSKKPQSKAVEGILRFLRNPQLAENGGRFAGHLVKSSASTVDDEVLEGLRTFLTAADGVTAPLTKEEQVALGIDTIQLATDETENTVDDSLALLLPTLLNSLIK